MTAGSRAGPRTVSIRPAEPRDRNAVLSLVPRLRAFGAPALRSIESLDDAESRTIERFFEAPKDGARLWVAADARDAVVGAAYTERSVDYFTGETHAHLGILAVAAAVEGQGVGRGLLATVEAWAAGEGFRFVTLNVFAENARAMAVYERAGYRPDTVRYVKLTGNTPTG